MFGCAPHYARSSWSTTPTAEPFLIRFAVLSGPINHLKHLSSPERLPFSAAYLGSLALTLYFSIAVSFFLPPPPLALVSAFFDLDHSASLILGVLYLPLCKLLPWWRILRLTFRAGGRLCGLADRWRYAVQGACCRSRTININMIIFLKCEKWCDMRRRVPSASVEHYSDRFLLCNSFSLHWTAIRLNLKLRYCTTDMDTTRHPLHHHFPFSISCHRFTQSAAQQSQERSP